MTNSYDPREAGKSITEAYCFLKDAYRQINELYRTAEAFFGECSPPWTADAPVLTWDNSTAPNSADRWIPRWFSRSWKRIEEDDEGWRSIASLFVYLEDKDGRNIPEPWACCILLEPTRPDSPQDWNRWMVSDAAWGNTKTYKPQRWLDKEAENVFNWTDSKKWSVRACGYYLALTDIKDEKDVRQLIVDPLVALSEGWDKAKVPQKLIQW